MRRRILLRGENSGTNYVHAETLIALEALDPGFREDLVNSTHPLGRLWVIHKLETRKEILKVWRRPAGELAEVFGLPADAACLARSYRVISSGRPIMLITESFPAGR
jgi:chorismate-pyruvate lyase